MNQSKPESRKPPGVRLGLVPSANDAGEEAASSGSDDEELDEEAVFQHAPSGPLTFEYNGEVAKLESRADIKAWIEQRKKLWPSRHRVEAKQTELRGRMDERRRIEAETRRMMEGSIRPTARTQAVGRVENQNAKTSKTGRILDEMRTELEKQTNKVEELRRQLAERGQGQAGANSSVSIPGDLQNGDSTQARHEDVAETAPGENQRDREQTHNTQSAAPTDGSGDQARNKRDVDPSGFGSDLDPDEDSAPEQESSKPASQPTPPTAAPPGICHAFAHTGRCKFGNKCRYQHVGPSRPHPARETRSSRNGNEGSGRKTLYQKVSSHSSSSG